MNATLPNIDLPGLNAQSRKTGHATLFQATVARQDSTGLWWLMNDRDGGWESFGKRFRSLREIAATYKVRFAEVGRDNHSLFVAINPA